MPSDIILIGPIGSGKSTQAKLLAEKLGLPRCSLDDVRWEYYNEIGYDRERADTIRESGGFAGVYRYWKPFEIHAVERLLSEHSGCVIDFGGGHSVYEDDALFARAQRALAPYENVVLLLPSPDLDESIRVLRERTRSRPGADFFFNSEFDYFLYWVKSPCNFELARTIVYTEGKTPEQTAIEVLGALNL